MSVRRQATEQLRTVLDLVEGVDRRGWDLFRDMPAVHLLASIEPYLAFEHLGREPSEGGVARIERLVIALLKELKVKLMDAHRSHHGVPGAAGLVDNGLTAQIRDVVQLGGRIEVAEEDVRFVHRERSLEHRGQHSGSLQPGFPLGSNKASGSPVMRRGKTRRP